MINGSNKDNKVETTIDKVFEKNMVKIEFRYFVSTLVIIISL